MVAIRNIVGTVGALTLLGAGTMLMCGPGSAAVAALAMAKFGMGGGLLTKAATPALIGAAVYYGAAPAHSSSEWLSLKAYDGAVTTAAYAKGKWQERKQTNEIARNHQHVSWTMASKLHAQTVQNGLGIAQVD